jgi:hypothetical protein
VSAFFETFPEKLIKEEKTDQTDEKQSAAADGDGDGVTPEGEFPPNLLQEWQEFFSVNVFSTILSMFVHVAGKTMGGW